MRRIAYSKDAVKTLRRMPANVSSTIRSKIEQYAVDPQSLANNVTALKGEIGFRLRVGDWRVVFVTRGDTIDVVKIGPRGSVYQ